MTGRPKGGELSEREPPVRDSRPDAATRTSTRSPSSTSGSSGMNTPASLPSDEHGARLADADDLALVRLVQGGDRAAFRALFDRYHRRVYAVALSVLKSPSDAHDVVQESFVKVHRYMQDFQGASSFYTWLYRICMNLSIDQLRRRKSARQVDYDDAVARAEEGDDPTHLAPVLSAGDPGKAQSRKELAARMQAALATLPEVHQQVIMLREVEGLSYEEIAKIMKVPKGTIMSRLFHARRKMQSALADYVDGELEPQDRDDP